MGFSLEAMFESFRHILSEPEISDQTLLLKIKEDIEWWRNYAVQCGKLED